MAHGYVCCDCGKEQDKGSSCLECSSVRVVLVSWIEDVVGTDWRENFDREDD
jgi:hypothetical protein